MKKAIGLFFGSFNPVHVGHMIIANYMATQTNLSKVWMVLSPHNPLKSQSSLANDYVRLNLLNLAIGDNDNIKSSDVEFKLPKPSYTIDTLTYLGEKYPNENFALIMGSDNLQNLNKWKNYEQLIDNYDIHVYRRPGYDESDLLYRSNVYIYDAPLMQISASYIRKSIRAGHSVQYLVPDAVYVYLNNNKVY